MWCYIAGPREELGARDGVGGRPGGVSRAFRAGLVFRGGELTKNVPFYAVPGLLGWGVSVCGFRFRAGASSDPVVPRRTTT